MPPLFAKEVPRGKETNVKESEKRKFRERCATTYPLLSPAQLDALVPSAKAASLRVCKLPPRDELFRCEWRAGLQQPIFFTQDAPAAGSGRGPRGGSGGGGGGGGGGKQLLPTLYSLHRAPQMLRAVRYWRPIEKNLTRGADLFLPGVARPDDYAEVGRARRSCVTKKNRRDAMSTRRRRRRDDDVDTTTTSTRR